MRVKFVFTPEWDEVTAVFVDEYEDQSMLHLLCYAHLGQHGTCAENWFEEQQPATLEQYAPLLEELKSIGYDDLTVL